MKKVFPKQDVAAILTFINDNVRRHKLKKNEENRAILMSEETLITMLEHTNGDEVTVGVSYIGGTLRIKLIAKGDAFDPLAVSDSDPMRSALMQSFASDIRAKNQKGTNVITITAYKSRYLLLYKLVGAGLLGLIVSLLLKVTLPAQVCQ